MFAKFSVKKPYTVIVGIILVIALGVISFMNMTTDLLPSMDLPYVIVYTSYTGATPEKVEAELSRPLEASFATLTDVKNVSSTSNENVSMVIMEFESGADMNTAMIEISSAVDQLAGGWDSAIGTPVIMKLNPDMLPVTLSSVSLEGADLLELSDYVEDELIARYEAVDGVARVSASGILTQQVDITIEQSRIDALNNAILAEVDSELADVELELRDAMSQISSGKRQLARARQSAYAQIDEAIAAIEAGNAQLPTAIETLTAQKEQLSAQLESAKAMLSQLEGLSGLTDAEKEQLRQAADTISALETQRDQLQKQLDEMGESQPDSALIAQLQAAQAARDEQAALKAAQEAYIADLKLLDAASLKNTITRLEQDVAANEAELSTVRSDLEAAITSRDAIQREIDDLNARIGALEASLATAAPTEAPVEETAVPTETAAETTQPETAASAETAAETAAPAEAAAPVETPAPETAAPVEAAAEEAQPVSLLEAFLGGAARAEGETLEELKAKLSDAQARLAEAQASVDHLSARHDSLRETLNDQSAALAQAKESLAIIEDGEITVQSRIEAAQQQIAACEKRMAELDQEIAELNAAIDQAGSSQALQAQIAALEQQIAQAKESDAYRTWLLISDSSALAGQYAQAQAAVSQLEAGIASIDEMLGKLNQGILPGGMIAGMDEDTDLAAARQQLESARSQADSAMGDASGKLSEAEDQINEAWKEFTDQRDEALENAGIDGIITVETISGILGSQNLELPAGYVSNAEDRYLVSVGNEFASLEELKQIKLFSLGMETVDDVRLLDVARVEISDNSADLFTFVNGENGVMLSFEKQSTASTAEVAANITAESERLMAENPRLDVTEMMNQGDYINLIVDSVLSNLVSGGVLAIAILLLFLLDWKPTLIVAISIPTSVVVAFVCMYFSGITLNVMSLSGLAIGIGMLVDNSIVAIENIYRMRDEEGLPILTASIRGVNQVSGALFSSTLTTICVFLPVVFIEGMARDLFSDMGLTIAFSLLASLLVSLTVVPSFSAALFKKSKPKKQRVFGAIQRGYTRLLRGALRVKPLVLLLAVALLAFTIVQVMDMPISFMPSVNSEQMSASLSFDRPDMADSEKEAIAIEIMHGIMEVDGVNDVSLSASSSVGLLASMSGGSAYSYYVLIEPEQRANADIAADMQAMAAEWADGEDVIFSVQTSTMDLTSMMGSGISVDITGEEIESLRIAAAEIADLLGDVSGVASIDDGSEAAEPKLIVRVDKELASDHSLSVAQVYQYIAKRLYGAVELTSADLDGREYTLYVSEDRNASLAPEDIQDMEIEVDGKNKTEFVRIGDIAQISYGESLSSIHRSSQKRSVSVTLSLAEGASASLVSRDVEALLKDYQPPEGCAINLSGENETVMGYMGDLVLMLLVAVLFIFLIMVAQFQSFKSPFIVMFTIPLAFTGGLLALIITGMDLSIVAMLGFLVLSGVVVNNGIVFVDSVNQMRIGGMSKKEALVETGRIRLRPILMTALTTILGMSTMAMATGMGAEMMQPMAVVIVGGLSYSTLMTLFVVPVLYDLFNGEKMKAREIEMMKEAAGMAREGFDDAPAAPAAPAAQAAPIEEIEEKPAKPKRIRVRF